MPNNSNKIITIIHINMYFQQNIISGEKHESHGERDIKINKMNL